MAKRICVVGAGHWGKNHIKTLHELGALGGIVESDLKKQDELKKQYVNTRFYEDLKDALSDSYDGYTVATPAYTHYSVGKEILEQRKPVLIEKPMALKVSEARELKQLADKKNVTLMVGHVLLFHPAIQKIKELIQDNKIGKLQYIYSNRLNLGTVRTEENILWSFAPHDIAIFEYLIECLPTEIISRGGAFLQPYIHDSTMTILKFPNNIVGHIFVSWLHPFKEHRIIVIGSKGMFVYEDSSDKKDLLFYEKGIDWVRGEPVKREGPTEIIHYDIKMPLTEELKYFIEHLDGEKPAISDGRNGVEVLEILEKATLSLLEEKPLNDNNQNQMHYFLHSSSFVDEHVEIGEGTKIWHFSHIQSNAKIGKNCTFGQNVNVGNNVVIGNHVKVQNNVSIYEGVELEDYVFCGPSMVFTNIKDPRCKYPQRGGKHYLRTLVKEGASIGANATIMCGITIGKHAFIGAGAVVTKDVPDYALMLGVPARQAGWACECGENLPPITNKITCPRCSIQYELNKEQIEPL